MKKQMGEDVQSVLEDVVFILNEVRKQRLKALEKTKLTAAQEKIVEGIEKDLQVCVTKVGLLLHPTEL